MRQALIERYDRNTSPAVREGARKFLESEVLMPQDITDIASRIAVEINQSTARHGEHGQLDVAHVIEMFAVLDVIYVGRLEDYKLNHALALHDPHQHYYSSEGEDFSVQDFSSALRRVRQAVLRELQKLLDPGTFHVIQEAINENVFTTHDQRIYKQLDDWHAEYPAEHHIALQALYDLPDRSPHIFYSIIQYDPDVHQRLDELDQADDRRSVYVARTDRALMLDLPLQTLKDYMQQDESSLGQALRYLLDGMRGAQFLLDHHLVASDFTLENIGINTQKNLGGLFDLDTLLPEGNTYPLIATKLDYVPPEYMAGDQSHLGESAMIYEFGVSIRKILQNYETSSNLTERQLEELRTLTTEITHNSADQRMTMAEAMRSLETILKI